MKRCFECGGIMKELMDKTPEDTKYKYYKCLSCGEEIMNMNQLKVLASKYRKLRKAKEVTFANGATA